MSKKKNDIIYTAADIEKYHKGLMSSQEMHALEKAALDDPFLADSLEGYSGQSNVPADIAELQERLMKRTEEKQTKVIPITGNKNYFSWWKLVAMIVLIAGAGLIVYQVGFNKKKDEIAEALQKEAVTAKTDSGLHYSPATTTTDTQAQKGVDQIGIENNLIEKESRKITKEPQPQSLKADPSQAEIKNADDLPVPNVVANAVPGLATEKTSREIKDSFKSDIASANKEYKLISREPQYELRNRAARTKNPVIDEEYKNAEGLAFKKISFFRGRVTDAHNNALPFSNITNTRDSIGTYADANGFFNLTSPDTILNVRVSSIGFESSVVALHNDIPANRIKLDEDRSSLSEVVISNKKPDSSRVRNSTMVLQDAEPADGWTNYDLYLANNLKEPGDFKEKKEIALKGEVELSFEVNRSGEPINITVKKSLCEACDKEAIRVLKEGPKWKRKARKGKTTVTIRF